MHFSHSFLNSRNPWTAEENLSTKLVIRLQRPSIRMRERRAMETFWPKVLREGENPWRCEFPKKREPKAKSIFWISEKKEKRCEQIKSIVLLRFLLWMGKDQTVNQFVQMCKWELCWPLWQSLMPETVEMNVSHLSFTSLSLSLSHQRHFYFNPGFQE